MAVEINNRCRSRIDLVLVRQAATSFLNKYRRRQSVSIVFVGDATIRRLNKIYRQLDRTTDVLAFPELTGAVKTKTDNQFVTPETDSLGELVINYAQIKRQARRLKHPVKAELLFILVHGLLHLLGHEDETEAGVLLLERLGRRFLAGFKKGKLAIDQNL
jgi:probable rRNA maturation factor